MYEMSNNKFFLLHRWLQGLTQLASGFHCHGTFVCSSKHCWRSYFPNFFPFLLLRLLLAFLPLLWTDFSFFCKYRVIFFTAPTLVQYENEKKPMSELGALLDEVLQKKHKSVLSWFSWQVVSRPLEQIPKCSASWARVIFHFEITASKCDQAFHGFEILL